MDRTLIKALAFFAPAALLIACSSSSGSGTSTTAGGGGHPSTSSAGSTTGSGGTSTTASGSGGTSTTASGSGGTTSSSSGTGGTPAGGACTDSADEAALASHQSTIQSDVTGCTISSGGTQAATSTCIQGKDGLTKACADCFATDGACGLSNCEAQCIGGASASCTSCLATNCTPAFDTCSGISGTPPTDGGDGG